MTDTKGRQIPWLRIFVEGVVIVVSVLLALAADAWWDRRQEAQEEQHLLLGLREDFEATLDVIAHHRDNEQRQATTAETLIAYGGSRSSEVSAAHTDTLLARVLQDDVFRAVDPTLAALLNSDGLGTVSNRELRALLAQWPGLVAQMEKGERQNENVIVYQFMPYLRARIPIRRLDMILSVSPGQPSAYAADSRVLLSDMTFENYLNDILYYAKRKLTNLDALEDHAHEVLSLITLELDRPLSGRGSDNAIR